MNNFRIIYLYTVSFITLIMLIGGIISTVNNFMSYIFPTSSVFFNDTSYYASNNNENSLQIRRNNYKNQKLKNSIISIIVIVIGTTMYKYHWNLIEKERLKQEV